MCVCVKECAVKEMRTVSQASSSVSKQVQLHVYVAQVVHCCWWSLPLGLV